MKARDNPRIKSGTGETPRGDSISERATEGASPDWSLASANLKGSEHREKRTEDDDVGATLVVALLAADAVREAGDHKARPYNGQCWRTFNPFRLAEASD